MTHRWKRPIIIIGIDLGTSFSAAAWLDWSDERRYKPRNIEVFRAEPLLPTVIDFGPTYPEVGRRISRNANCVITGFQFKSKIGEGVAFSLPEECSRKEVSPEEAAERILKFLHEQIERWIEKKKGELRGKIDWSEVETTLAIPAFISSKQADRSEVFRSLARKAGFSTVRIIEEPIAALLDVDWQDPGILPTQDQTILLLDYGGGTCDVAIVRTGHRSIFWRNDKGEILAVASELCGGQFVDETIANWLRLQRKGKDKYELMEQARRLKEKLSSEGSSGDEILAYEKFEELSRPIIERMYKAIEIALEEAQRVGKTMVVVDKVVLTGGGSQHPLVSKLISEFFRGKQKNEPDIISAPIPQLNVSRGAALYGFYQIIRHKIPIYAEVAYDLILVFPNGQRRRLARRGQQIPFKKPNRFVFQVIRSTDVIVLLLYRRNEKGEEEEYARVRLKFPRKIFPGRRLFLDIEVGLRGYVYIYGRVPKQQVEAEAIVRISLS